MDNFIADPDFILYNDELTKIFNFANDLKVNPVLLHSLILSSIETTTMSNIFKFDKDTAEEVSKLISDFNSKSQDLIEYTFNYINTTCKYLGKDNIVAVTAMLALALKHTFEYISDEGFLKNGKEFEGSDMEKFKNYIDNYFKKE